MTKTGAHKSDESSRRRHAEAIMQQEIHGAQKYFDLAATMIVVLDAEGRTVLVNKKGRQILACEEAEINGQDWFDSFVPEDVRDEARTVFRRVVEGEVDPMAYQESAIRTAAGNEKVVAWHNVLVTDEDGGITGVVASGEDITEQGRAQKELQASEKRFRALIENAPDAIVILTGDGTARYESPSVRRMFGRKPKIGVVAGLLDHIHPDDMLKVGEAFDQLLQNPGGTRRAELRVSHGDGSWRSIEATASNLLNDPAVEGIVVNMRDVSERKRAEEALWEGERCYRLLAENAKDVIWVADMKLKPLYVSPSITSLLGYSVEEAMSRSMEESLTPESAEIAAKTFARELERYRKGQDKASASHTLELEMRRKDGSTVWAESTVTFVPGLDGQPVEILGVVRDISERKRAEDKLQQAYQQEKKLRQQWETEVKKRIEFTRALVHELKTPLTSVLACSELLLSDLPEGHLQRLAKNLYRGASNLDSRIDELFDVARGELGMLQLRREAVAPLKILHLAFHDMAPVAASRGQLLLLDVPSSLPLVWADQVRLRQVLLNLLGNASKFTPEGGNITLRASVRGTELMVAVEDTGPGIAEEERQRLFEAYYRLDGDRENLSGLGLGLALCKTLVELHGGQIWVESQVGQGSTFAFSLPLYVRRRRSTPNPDWMRTAVPVAAAVPA